MFSRLDTNPGCKYRIQIQDTNPGCKYRIQFQVGYKSCWVTTSAHGLFLHLPILVLFLLRSVALMISNISQIFLISDSFSRQRLLLHSDRLQPETGRETDTSGTPLKVFNKQKKAEKPCYQGFQQTNKIKEQTIEKPCNQGFQQTNNRETPLSKFSTNNKQKIQQTNNRETLLSGRTLFPNYDLAGGHSQVETIHAEQHPRHPLTMKGENKW